MKTKATLRVRFASPSCFVFVIPLFPWTQSSAGFVGRRGYYAFVGNGSGNSLGTLFTSNLVGLLVLNGMLTSLTPTIPSVCFDGPGRFLSRPHGHFLSLLATRRPRPHVRRWSGLLSFSPPTGGLGPLPQCGEHLDVLPEERSDQARECGAPRRRPTAHHCVRRADAIDGGRGEKGQEVRMTNKNKWRAWAGRSPRCRCRGVVLVTVYVKLRWGDDEVVPTPRHREDGHVSPLARRWVCAPPPGVTAQQGPTRRQCRIRPTCPPQHWRHCASVRHH